MIMLMTFHGMLVPGGTLKNQSPISQTCRQRKRAPTSVTNIRHQQHCLKSSWEYLRNEQTKNLVHVLFYQKCTLIPKIYFFFVVGPFVTHLYLATGMLLNPAFNDHPAFKTKSNQTDQPTKSESNRKSCLVLSGKSQVFWRTFFRCAQLFERFEEKRRNSKWGWCWKLHQQTKK